MKLVKFLGLLCLLLCLVIALLPQGTFAINPKQDLQRAGALVGVLVVLGFSLLYLAYMRDRPTPPRAKRLPLVGGMLLLAVSVLSSCSDSRYRCVTQAGNVVILDALESQLDYQKGDKVAARQVGYVYKPVYAPQTKLAHNIRAYHLAPVDTLTVQGAD